MTDRRAACTLAIGGKPRRDRTALEISRLGIRGLFHNGRTRRQVNARSDRRSLAQAIALAAAMLVPSVARFAEGAEPAPLGANTLAAFDRYVKLTEARNEEEQKRGTNLLWVDELPRPERADAYAALERGEVKM